MSLAPQLQALLLQLAELDAPPLHTLEPLKARQLAETIALQVSGDQEIVLEAVASIKNQTIPGSVAEIPVRIYTPFGKGWFPILVFFHGGGWVMGNLEAADFICRSLANGASCIVVSVDYRLAPEHKFPAALEDAYAAIQWVADCAATFKGDAKRIAVGGDSAGGNLAAAVALMARDQGYPQLMYQLLIYPPTHYAFDTQSYRDYGRDYPLSTDLMMWFWNHYLPDAKAGDSFYASPLLATNLSGLPPALIITAEFDALRDEGEAYAARLVQAGVPVKLIRYLGMIHAFIGIPQVWEQGKQALTEAARELEAAFKLNDS